MTGDEIFKAICLSYRHDRTPAVCAPDYPDLQKELGHLEDFSPPRPGFGRLAFLVVIVLVVLINIYCIVRCMRRKKRENENEIQN